MKGSRKKPLPSSGPHIATNSTSGPKRVRRSGSAKLADVSVRRRDRRDILSSAEYLDEHGSAEIAQRFLDAIQGTFEELAKMPKLGAYAPSVSQPFAAFAAGR